MFMTDCIHCTQHAQAHVPLLTKWLLALRGDITRIHHKHARSWAGHARFYRRSLACSDCPSLKDPNERIIGIVSYRLFCLTNGQTSTWHVRLNTRGIRNWQTISRKNFLDILGNKNYVNKLMWDYPLTLAELSWGNILITTVQPLYSNTEDYSFTLIHLGPVTRSTGGRMIISI